MSLSYLVCIWTIVAATYGQSNAQASSDCLGSLRWSTTATTVMDGSGSDPLGLPLGLFIEPRTQILYVADGPNNRVQKRYPNGQVVTAAGQANGAGGSTAETLWNPINIVADEKENLYVADWNNQRIQLWEKNAKKGTTVAGNGTRGSALNEFSYPSSIALDSKGNLHVADTQNQRITQWSLSSNPKESIGTITAGGNGAGLNTSQLNNPMDFYYDEPNGIYYITNEDSHSITQWVIGDYEPRNIYAGIPGRFGNTSAQLTYPHGITMDRFGNLYVADVSNSRIQVFCPDAVFGITIAGTGVTGKGSDQLSYPTAVALDAQMNLYVSDTFNNRVQKFERMQ